MANRPRITMAIQAKVLGWLMQNKETLLQQSVTDVIRKIEIDLGVKLNHHQLTPLEQSIGVHRVRGGTSEYRKDRAKIIASELIRLMETLGAAPSQDLRDILQGS